MDKGRKAAEASEDMGSILVTQWELELSDLAEAASILWK